MEVDVCGNLQVTNFLFPYSLHYRKARSTMELTLFSAFYAYPDWANFYIVAPIRPLLDDLFHYMTVLQRCRIPPT